MDLKKWEYKVVHLKYNDDKEMILNSLGSQGWELVTSCMFNTIFVDLIFKRINLK